MGDCVEVSESWGGGCDYGDCIDGDCGDTSK